MKVLLAAKYMPNGPRPIGGVQSWVLTVADELARLGHKVTMWQPGFFPLLTGFDVGIFSNWMYTAPLGHLCERALVISHGIIPEEAPPRGMKIAFTSEGVRDHWKGNGHVIRQPIDLGFWTPFKDRSNELVRYSYRGGLGWLFAAADGLGLAYRHVRNATHGQARDKLAGAACVLATGRAALEAMACGTPVVICDHRSAYQNALLDPDTLGAMTRNYSGRGGFEPQLEGTMETIRLAMKQGSLRWHVEANHDVRRIVPQLLEAACST